ncbi:MAG: energy transducer TonB [Bacteroidota bacterium]|nr:energy transducer TonB [Bacteroidota bacterium]
MEPGKILSANILDLLFDGRNKEYGAYELRKTYPKRIMKALALTTLVALLAFTGVALANSLQPKEEGTPIIKDLTLIDIPQDEKFPEPLPEPKKPEPPIRVRTERLVAFNIVPNEKADDPPATTDDLHDAKIDLEKKDGVADVDIANPKDIDGNKGIIETKKNDEYDGTAIFVQVEAKFKGDWEKFLTRNLDPTVPANNGAPAGRYTVMIQFVVDLEGNVSDIKPMTNYGYGLEQEAIRVLKKATKWEPAFQNGHRVKAYRRQPITFVIEE